MRRPSADAIRRGVDTNVLVYAHLPSMPDHAVVRRHLEEHLASDNATLVLTPSILHEFVHVVSDPRRFEPPVTMSEAIAVARAYLGRSNCEVVPIDEGAISYALDLVEQHGLGRKRLADTIFAAALHRNGVRQLLTCNPGDFEGLGLLEVIDPRGPGLDAEFLR